MTVPSSAVGLLHQGVFRSYSDLLARRRKKAGNLPNVLFREIASLNENATFEGLDADFRQDIAFISKQLLAYINSQGYVVVPKAN